MNLDCLRGHRAGYFDNLTFLRETTAMKLSSCQAIALAMMIFVALGCRSAQTAPAAPPGATDLPTSATANGQTIVAIAPPAQACCPQPTLPEKLGITGLFKGIGGLIDRIRNRLGSRFPGLEAKPPVLAITDPANAESSNPAVAAAAGAKAEEDAAAQKVKAIRYLGSLGCGGCYPDVEPALLAALDDCTEAVRYEAVLALRKSGGDPCKNCQKDACCSDKVREKLDKIANGMDDQGCYFEASDRVRRNARLALCYCGGPTSPQMQQTLPQEGPSEEIPPATAPAAGAVSIPKSQVEMVAERIERSVIASKQANTTTGGVNRQVAYDQATGSVTEVRWEQLSARIDQFASRADAAGMMNLVRTHVLTAGGPLPPELTSRALEVARFDWTNAERLVSRPLASALATTQVGGLSLVWEENGRLWMVRVLERRKVNLVQPASYSQPVAPSRDQAAGVSAQPRASAPVGTSAPAPRGTIQAAPASAPAPANGGGVSAADNAAPARAPVVFTTRVVPCNCNQH